MTLFQAYLAGAIKGFEEIETALAGVKSELERMEIIHVRLEGINRFLEEAIEEQTTTMQNATKHN